MKNTCEGFNLPFFCRSYLKLTFHPPITYDRHFENLWCRLPSYHILIFNATQNQTHRNSSVSFLWKFNTLIFLFFFFFYRYNLSDKISLELLFQIKILFFEMQLHYIFIELKARSLRDYYRVAINSHWSFQAGKNHSFQ